PSPSISISSPLPRPVSHSSTTLRRLSASPRQSKPAPRLAVEAGVETDTFFIRGLIQKISPRSARRARRKAAGRGKSFHRKDAKTQRKTIGDGEKKTTCWSFLKGLCVLAICCFLVALLRALRGEVLFALLRGEVLI